MVAGVDTSARCVPFVNTTGTPGVRSETDASVVAADDTISPCRTSGVRARAGWSAVVAQQRLPELPVAHEVHVLLEVQQVGTDALERRCDRRREVRREHLADDGLGEVLQAGALGAFDELVEVERQVRPLEMLVKEVRVRRPTERARLLRSAAGRTAPVSADADARNVSSARACSICSCGSANCPA